LIFSEAGGHVARVDGRAYHPLSRVWGLLCAPTEQSWQDIHDHLATPN
jgi:fructose-1,6-bisphosphatase/inositol monophosphatase family enzyme